MAVRVFHRDRPSARVPMIARDARLLAWPGVGAWSATITYVHMEPGEENVPHEHEYSEDMLFILAGRASIADLTNGTVHEIGAGDVIVVPQGLRHQVRADLGSRLESVGGPCPADLRMLEAAGLSVDPQDAPG
jgi:quercetin dioxygenase-like cupin family protein